MRSRLFLLFPFLAAGLLSLPLTSGCGQGGGGVMCNAIESTPPVITVHTSNGSKTCAPSFALLGGDSTSPDGGAGAMRCPSDLAGCDPEAGAGACQFILGGLDGDDDSDGSPGVSVEVSMPGFETTTLHGIHAGIGGCVPTVPASDVEVTLTASADAG